ncbi:MAG: DUF1501 domain-containing protein [Acidimicrobiales bacterium]|nr:DUF1501 domain-containing protein [Acidimicrobiales bacterium]
MTQLLNVFLRGGADGLSIFAPVGDPIYHRSRPTLALSERAALDVGIDGFGLHPSAPRLAELLKDKKCAVIPAAGFEGQSRSHFSAQALLESANSAGADPNEAGTGWLGHLLNSKASKHAQPFRAVAVGTVSVAPSLWGTTDALSVSDPSALALGVLRRSQRRNGSYEVMDAPFVPSPQELATRWPLGASSPEPTTAGVAAAAAVLDRLEDSPIEVGDISAFGEGDAAAAFASASALLLAGLGTEVVQVDLGDWDTHNEQGTNGGHFAELLSELDAGLGAIFERHVGKAHGLVITVMTEFGRRVQQNASGGTDHGSGSVALVLGDGVQGGMKGIWPGLEDLDEGDVRFTNDLRVMQSEVANAVFGAELAKPSGSTALELFDV